MAELSTRFVRQVQRSLKRHIPWTPNLSVTLGDVGVLVDGVFEHRTSLATLGIDFTSISKAGDSTIDFASRSGVAVAIATGARRGDVAAIGARARITFSKTGDGILQASDVDIAVIDDPASVAAAILGRFAAGTWERDWVFVSEVQTAAATTVMVSEGRNASIEMDAAGAIGSEAPLSAGFVVSRKSGGVLSWVGARGLTPLFALSRIKPSVLDDLFGEAGARGSPMKLPPRSMLRDTRTLLEEVPLDVPPRRRTSSAPPPKSAPRAAPSPRSAPPPKSGPRAAPAPKSAQKSAPRSAPKSEPRSAPSPKSAPPSKSAPSPKSAPSAKRTKRR